MGRKLVIHGLTSMAFHVMFFEGHNKYCSTFPLLKYPVCITYNNNVVDIVTSALGCASEDVIRKATMFIWVIHCCIGLCFSLNYGLLQMSHVSPIHNMPYKRLQDTYNITMVQGSDRSLIIAGITSKSDNIIKYEVLTSELVLQHKIVHAYPLLQSMHDVLLRYRRYGIG